MVAKKVGPEGLDDRCQHRLPQIDEVAELRVLRHVMTTVVEGAIAKICRISIDGRLRWLCRNFPTGEFDSGSQLAELGIGHVQNLLNALFAVFDE